MRSRDLQAFSKAQESPPRVKPRVCGCQLLPDPLTPPPPQECNSQDNGGH